MRAPTITVGCSAAVALVAAAGCPDHTISKVTTVQSGAITKTIPVEADLDVLFVIDDSASTADKQKVFAQNFTNFVTVLSQFPSPTGSGYQLPNLHIGVVSTTVGLGSTSFGGCPQSAPADDGLLHNQPVGSDVAACGMLNGQFISDFADPANPGMRLVNYTGTLATELGCIAQLGSGGCGFEAPLEGMKRALDGSRPENAGFIRDNAYLAVIFLTDEDDCSVADDSLFTLGSDVVGNDDLRCQPVYAYNCDQPISPFVAGTYTNCSPRLGGYLQDPSYYFDFLASVKKDPSQIVIAMIAGDPETTISVGPIAKPFVQALALEPSCTAMINDDYAIGRPGIRLASFTQQFGTRGLFASVCQTDYSMVFSQIGQLLFNAISPCLEGALDTTDQEPSNPGVQPPCVVTDVGSNGDVEDQIQPCQMTDPNTPDPSGARPCWWVKSDPATCTTQTGLALHVERTAAAPSGTSEQVSCAVAPQ